MRPLNGIAKDAWLRRQIADGGSTEALTRRLQAEIASLKVRGATDAETESARTGPPGTDVAGEAPVFDPYAPNIVVVVRTRGRAAAEAALAAIGSVDNLRWLAREQSLAVDAALADPASVRAAIVTAAERRIANRRAAAS